MKKKAKVEQILAQALLLAPDDRERLIVGLEDATSGQDQSFSESELAEFKAVVDEVIEAAQVENQRRRKSDVDVPKQWHSCYYLRQSYCATEPRSREASPHARGGELPRPAKCGGCGESMHLIWDIDCTDARFRRDTPKAFGKLKRLPLLYCLHCPTPNVYRCQPNGRISILPRDRVTGEESPFSDFPPAFPREKMVLRAVPTEIENLLLLTQLAGDDWPRRADQLKIARFFRDIGVRTSRIGWWRSQLGGLPFDNSSRDPLLCPFSDCPTHAWGHPLMRRRSFYEMKQLAIVNVGLEFHIEAAASIEFRICWACQAIRSNYTCD